MGLRLNLAFPLKEYDNIVFNDIVWVIAAGPLFTLLQGLVFYFIQRKSDNRLLYPFLLTPFYMRLLAAIISFINLNDEATISKEIGIGAATLPVIVCLVLLLLNYDIARRKKYSAKFIIITLLLILVFSSILVLWDMHFKTRII